MCVCNIAAWAVHLQKFISITIDPFLAELLRQLEEFDANISALQKTKIQLTNQLEESANPDFFLPEMSLFIYIYN